MEIRACFALIGIGLALAACARSDPQACRPPRDYWQKPHNFLGLRPPANDVSLTHDGTIYWNGERVTRQQLSRYLKESHRLNPEPDVFLQTEMGASCRDLEAVRDRMDQALECKRDGAHCAEGIKTVWRNMPDPPGMQVS